MFGSDILDVAIGLAFVYFLLSLICSAFRESIEAWEKRRAVYLERGIRELLKCPDGTSLPDGASLVEKLYKHPLVYGLFLGEYDSAKIRKNGLMPARSNLPSYIPAENFAAALLDIVARSDQSTGSGAVWPAPAPISLEEIRDSVPSIENPPVERALLWAIDTAQGDLARAQANLV
jgi:hypothetical protein